MLRPGWTYHRRDGLISRSMQRSYWQRPGLANAASPALCGPWDEESVRNHTLGRAYIRHG